MRKDPSTPYLFAISVHIMRIFQKHPFGAQLIGPMYHKDSAVPKTTVWWTSYRGYNCSICGEFRLLLPSKQVALVLWEENTPANITLLQSVDPNKRINSKRIARTIVGMLRWGEISYGIKKTLRKSASLPVVSKLLL